LDKECYFLGDGDFLRKDRYYGFSTGFVYNVEDDLIVIGYLGKIPHSTVPKVPINNLETKHWLNKIVDPRRLVLRSFVLFFLFVLETSKTIALLSMWPTWL